jgi:nucleoside-diphosphate-sugar epimerase
MHRAIVSGITGHLGRELTRQLVAAGVEVHGLTRQDIRNAQSSVERAHLHSVDGSTDTLIRILTDVQPDMIFHLAALYRRDHTIAEVVPLIEANIRFGAQLLEAARQCECRCFITAGSCLQYSDTGEYRPLNLYAATKQSYEDLLTYYTDAFGLAAVCLTLCNIYSEHDTAPRLMTDITKAWIHGSPLTLQKADVPIDLIHVEDAVAAFMTVAGSLQSEAEASGLRRYSVSSGMHVTPLEIVTLFERVGQRKLTVTRCGVRHSERRQRPWRGVLVPGWAPRVPLESGIRRIVSRWK